MRKPVRDCSLLRVLEQSRLIMDLFKQRRTSYIKARKMAYYGGKGEMHIAGVYATKFMLAIWSRKLTLST